LGDFAGNGAGFRIGHVAYINRLLVER
jgi:hypothetical protein